jgi:hypothetical protein
MRRALGFLFTLACAAVLAAAPLIVDPRQQLLVHRPRDVGQDARPIRASS